MDIVSRIKKARGIPIHILGGAEEAALIAKAIAVLIAKAISPFIESHDSLHVDVGGGHTEVNPKLGKEKVASQSFKRVSWAQLGYYKTPT